MVRHVARAVKVRGYGINYVNKCPHKDRDTTVHVCVSLNSDSIGSKVIVIIETQLEYSQYDYSASECVCLISDQLDLCNV